jgi:DNA invertase Pin-like site-specific DNA recombinase
MVLNAHDLGRMAVFERELIHARASEGRERAKAQSVRIGGPSKLAPHQIKEAIRRRDHGDETLDEIGRSYNVSGWTISRLLIDYLSCEHRKLLPSVYTQSDCIFNCLTN